MSYFYWFQKTVPKFLEYYCVKQWFFRHCWCTNYKKKLNFTFWVQFHFPEFQEPRVTNVEESHSLTVTRWWNMSWSMVIRVLYLFLHLEWVTDLPRISLHKTYGSLAIIGVRITTRRPKDDFVVSSARKNYNIIQGTNPGIWDIISGILEL